MNKNTHYIISVEKGEKAYAYAVTIPNNCNLCGFMENTNGFNVVSMNACSTFKKAQEVADFWNKRYKEQNRFYYD